MSEFTKSSAPSEAHIFIVDDNIPMSLLYEQILEFEGYEVFVANSRADALKIANSSPKIRLLLLDCIMPDMEIEDFLAQFRASNCFDAQTIVVGLSSMAPDSPIALGMKLLVDYYFEKPSDLDSFIDMVKRLTAAS